MYIRNMSWRKMVTELAKNIRKANITLTDWAEKANISRPALYRVIEGGGKVEADTVEAVIRAGQELIDAG